MTEDDYLNSPVDDSEKEIKRRKGVRENEELSSIDKTTPFKTRDFEVFKENLSKMKMEEIRALAVEVGISVELPATRLHNALLKAFLREFGITKRQYKTLFDSDEDAKDFKIRLEEAYEEMKY